MRGFKEMRAAVISCVCTFAVLSLLQLLRVDGSHDDPSFTYPSENNPHGGVSQGQRFLDGRSLSSSSAGMVCNSVPVTSTLALMLIGHTCGIVDEAAKCWGYNGGGESQNTPEGVKFKVRCTT